MKKTVLFLLCLMLGVGVCDARKKDRTKASVMISREIVLDQCYTGLSVGNTIRVVLEKDRNPENILIETEGIPADRVQAVVRDGMLVLSYGTTGMQGESRRNSRQIIVHVGTGSLGRFDCSGGSSVYSVDPIDCPVVEISAMGASEVAFGVRCRSLRMSLCGASSYRGHVACEEAAVFDAMGASEIFGEFGCGTLAMNLSGASSCAGKLVCRMRGELIATGASECFFDIDCPDLSLALLGASSYRGQTVRADVLSVSMMGASDCAVAGSVRRLKLDLSRSSDFRGANFIVSDLADCLLLGASSAEVHCIGELSFDVGERSDLRLYGNPVLKTTVPAVENAKGRVKVF